MKAQTLLNLDVVVCRSAYLMQTGNRRTDSVASIKGFRFHSLGAEPKKQQHWIRKSNTAQSLGTSVYYLCTLSLHAVNYVRVEALALYGTRSTTGTTHSKGT